MTSGKTIALTRWTFVGKVMSLLFNMLSRLVITFLPRSKCFLISWLQSPSAVNLEPPKNKVPHRFHCLPSYFPWLVLENAEEPEIKLPTSAGSSKKQESFRKTSITALLTMPKPLTVWITMEIVTDFIFGGSKITADGDCSCEIKRCLLFGRKAMANLDSILKVETLLC